MNMLSYINHSTNLNQANFNLYQVEEQDTVRKILKKDFENRLIILVHTA